MTDSSARPTPPPGERLRLVSESIEIQASPASLSPDAQSALLVLLRLGDNGSLGPRRCTNGIEVAAVFYQKALKYYYHPERGKVEICWSTLSACLRVNHPEMFDVAARRRLMDDDTFCTAMHLFRELMLWSGHLETPPGASAPPLVLREETFLLGPTGSARLTVRLVRLLFAPLWWVGAFGVFLVVELFTGRPSSPPPSDASDTRRR